MAARTYIYRYTYTHIDIKSILIFTNTLTFAKISKDNSRYFLPYRINIVFITTRNIFHTTSPRHFVNRFTYACRKTFRGIIETISNSDRRDN